MPRGSRGFNQQNWDDGGGNEIEEGPAVDQTILIGDVAADSLDSISAALGAQDLGAVAVSLGVDTFTTRTFLGDAAAAFAPQDATGTALMVLGDHGHVMLASVDGSIPAQLGATAVGGFTADSTLTVSQRATASSQSGADWANIANTHGQDDGTFAEIEAANSVLGGDSYDDVLSIRQYGLALQAEPSGFTRSAVDLLVRQAWKTNVNALDLLSTLSHSLILADNTGTPIRTLQSWGRSSPDSTSQHTDTYALSDAEFDDADRLQFDADCTLAIGTVLTSTVWWRAWWASIDITYTKTGIS